PLSPLFPYTTLFRSHRGVATGILAEQLVPDVEPGRDIPDTLQERQQPVALGQERRKIEGGPESENRVVVVDQRDLAISHVDVARHLDERRLGPRDDVEGVAQRV